MRRRIPTDYLSLRLEVLDQVADVDSALATATLLEAEADMVAHWTPARWLEQGARWARLRSAAIPDPKAELCDYLFGTVMTIALDPIARRELVVADQVVAAVLRGRANVAR